jgi:hypothetical protein
MRGFVAIAAAGAVLGTVAVSSTASLAAMGSNAMGSNKATAVGAASLHRREVAQRRHRHRHAARPAPESTTREGGAAPGCYRWGETGYHWYNFCLGPSLLYPHQRVCRGGYCWYYQ